MSASRDADFDDLAAAVMYNTCLYRVDLTDVNRLPK